ncbi:hypothetical protein EI94DRAFT_1726946 [Lactarius quietus]|nr:hypothetical protein EI94DRAFT_1726946 [Lactarius quietus]
MWKNIVETNIIVGTYPASLITGVMLKGLLDSIRNWPLWLIRRMLSLPLPSDDTTSFK